MEGGEVRGYSTYAYLESFALLADEVVEEVPKHLRDAGPQLVHHEGILDALAHVRQHAQKQLRLRGHIVCTKTRFT